MVIIIIKIFFFSFLLNLGWEVCQSVLYRTCQEKPLNDYVKLILKASLKDAFFISLFYLITTLIFNNFFILQNYLQLAAFVLLGLAFSFIDEKISLKLGRWRYADKMPKILGVGLSPLLELALTGIISFFFVL